MHSRLDRLENNKDLINLLKKCGCSEEIINGILKFSDQDFNLFQERVKKQPDLLTALVENGCDSEAIKTTFCYNDDEIYDIFLKYKEFVVLLLENQHSSKCIEYIYKLILLRLDPQKYCPEYVKQISQNFDIPFEDVSINNNMNVCPPKGFMRNFPELSKCSKVFKENWIYISSTSFTRLDMYRKNTQLFCLLIKNGLFITVQELYKRDNYEAIDVKNNKELLDFLLKEQLITLDQDKKDLITHYPLASSLLETGELIISDLMNCSLEEITEKVERLAKEKIVETDKSLVTVAQSINIAYQRDNVQTLKIHATAAVIKPQKAPESLEEIKITEGKAAGRWCNIM